MLRLNRGLDLPQHGAARPHVARLCDDRLLLRVLHESAVLVHAKAEGHLAAEVAPALALVALRLRHALTDARPLRLRERPR